MTPWRNTSIYLPSSCGPLRIERLSCMTPALDELEATTMFDPPLAAFGLDLSVMYHSSPVASPRFSRLRCIPDSDWVHYVQIRGIDNQEKPRMS
ncbi:hypothetical protein AB1N83_006746 [Pleurotus pulmonarius]